MSRFEQRTSKETSAINADLKDFLSALHVFNSRLYSNLCNGVSGREQVCKHPIYYYIYILKSGFVDHATGWRNGSAVNTLFCSSLAFILRCAPVALLANTGKAKVVGSSPTLVEISFFFFASLGYF